MTKPGIAVRASLRDRALGLQQLGGAPRRDRREGGPPGWLRALGGRVLLTGADQCVASLSNFAVGVAIARVGGIAALGAYSLAYVIWLALAGVHRALIAEPMAIENDVRQPDAAQNVQIGFAGELGMGAVLALVMACIGGVLLAAGQHAYGVAFVALSPWVPFLLVQDYWRWVAFMKASPGKALSNDALFDVVQGGAFVLLFFMGLRSSVLAIVAWGLGAAAGTLFGLWQHAVVPSMRGGIGRIRERWPMSRGLLGGSITNWGSQQSYVVLTGILLGPVGIGGLRAALSLVSGPTYVMLQAGGSIGLPEASKALHDRGWNGLRGVERAVTAAGMLSIAVVGLAVLVFGRQLLVLLYGPGFGRFAPTAEVLALAVLVGTASLGAILGLKATKLTGMLFWSNLFALVVSVVAVVAMVPLFGVEGAAAAAVVRSAAGSSVQLLLHGRHARRAAAVVTGRRRRAQRASMPAEEGVPPDGRLKAPAGTGPERRVGYATESITIW